MTTNADRWIVTPSGQESGLRLLSDLPSYAIALPERVSQIIDELSPHRIDVEIFPAVDMRRAETPGNWLGNGKDYGCSLSWLGVLDHALQKGDELFCVFEDDFVFRYDVLDRIPDLAEIEACPFEVIYLTGHYAKGGTRVEPRRFPMSSRLVRTSGIHGTAGRIFRRSYAAYLLDRLGRDIRDNGYGTDRTDSIVQTERRRTYAFEGHIGGQRQADFRSWEPRGVDYRIRGAASVFHAYPSDLGTGDLDQSRATIALASRVSRIAAINCSARTLGLLAEGVTDRRGHVQAFNDAEETESFLASETDQLDRYVSYESLSYNRLDDLADAAGADAVYIEMRRGLGEAEAMDLYRLVAGKLKADGLLMVSPRAHAEPGWLDGVPTRRLHASFGTLVFCTPTDGAPGL